jgi:hypothetical protein
MVLKTKLLINRLIQLTGYQIIRSDKYHSDAIIDSDAQFQRIYNLCKEYTMISRERCYSLYTSTMYAAKNMKGDFVECGVWRGGAAMIIAHTLIELGVTNKKIYLYDTFEGMDEPTDKDTHVANKNLTARSLWLKNKKANHNEWCYASFDEVKKNMESTKYPKNNIVYIKGKVEDTIPDTVPRLISVLRLDTDLYESTKHELEYLYPKVENGGVIIFDDYGTWGGSKLATDE